MRDASTAQERRQALVELEEPAGGWRKPSGSGTN